MQREVLQHSVQYKVDLINPCKSLYGIQVPLLSCTIGHTESHSPNHTQRNFLNIIIFNLKGPTVSMTAILFHLPHLGLRVGSRNTCTQLAGLVKTDQKSKMKHTKYCSMYGPGTCTEALAKYNNLLRRSRDLS